jgi:glycosyltransferase involved in cell wall biosynthesis
VSRGTRIPVVVEVTDTLSIDFTTGIQRVVREVVNGLDGLEGPDPGFEVVPVVTPMPGAGFRRLTGPERERLRTHPAGGRAGRRADDFGRLSPLVRRVADLPLAVRARTMLAGLPGRRHEIHPPHPELAYTPPPGSVFLDLEGSWYDPTPRAALLPRLAEGGVHRMVFVHDVMPVVHPEWFTPRHISVFRTWLDAHLDWSERVLTNSHRTAQDLRDVARREGGDHDPVVVPLGADHPVSAVRPLALPSAIGRFLLVVGTLEPRKNQRIVLDAFDRLAGSFPDLGLVLVGKEGWMVDELVDRVRTHPEHGRRLQWLGGVDDDQLGWLYEEAYLCIAPSLYEGFGVPVTEALGHGCATIVSTGGAQPEAAGGAAELFEPTDVEGLTRLIERHLTDPSHHERALAAARAHEAPTWAQTTGAFAHQILRVVTGD